MFDLTIIGGGPVGIYAATYAGRQGLSVHLIEAAPQLGGQPALLYPEKYIYDLPTFSSISAKAFVDRLLEQLPQEVTVTTGQYVLAIAGQEPNFEIRTSAAAYPSKRILIATGNGIFAPRKLIQDKGQYDNVHYHVPDLGHFQNKSVAIFGGGDSAVDWALMLAPLAKKVLVVHRRTEFRAHEASLKKLLESSVEVRAPYLLVGLKGENRKVSCIELENVETKSLRSEAVDEIMVLYGFSPSAGPQKEWGIRLQRNDIAVDKYQASSRSGIFAAGDACCHEGKIKMIATGISEAIVAVDAILESLN